MHPSAMQAVREATRRSEGVILGFLNHMVDHVRVRSCSAGGPGAGTAAVTDADEAWLAGALSGRAPDPAMVELVAPAGGTGVLRLEARDARACYRCCRRPMVPGDGTGAGNRSSDLAV